MGNSPSSGATSEQLDDARRVDDVERCMATLTADVSTGMYRPIAILPHGEAGTGSTLGVLWHDLRANVPRFATVVSVDAAALERLDSETRARFSVLAGDVTSTENEESVGGLYGLVEAALDTDSGRVEVFTDTSAFRL